MTDLTITTTWRSAVSGSLGELRTTLMMFGLRGWVFALLGAAAAMLAIGTLAAIFDNPYFTRMTPVRTQDYVIWIATGVLIGLVAGTYGVSSAAGSAGKALAGGFFADLAVGCPICNKAVVLLIGTSGALTYFDPLQLWIGVASVGLLAWTLLLRARAVTGQCAVQAV